MAKEIYANPNISDKYGDAFRDALFPPKTEREYTGASVKVGYENLRKGGNNSNLPTNESSSGGGPGSGLNSSNSSNSSEASSSGVDSGSLEFSGYLTSFSLI